AKTMPDKIREHRDVLLMSLELATIKLYVDLPLRPSDLQIQPSDSNAIIELYIQSDFRRWLSEAFEHVPVTDRVLGVASSATEESVETQVTARKQDYEVITSKERFTAWLEQIQQADVVAFDTETTSLNYMTAELVGMSFSLEPGRACYIPVGHD